MLTVKTGLLAIVTIGMLAGQAQAQQKLYRWVDKNGKVHISDTLPQEAVEQARTEFNADTGNSTATVGRALTPEERAIAAAEKAAAEKAAADAEMLKRIEAAMLENYENEDQLRRAYDERINLSKQTVESTQISISSQRSTLTAMLNDAAEAELAKRAVTAERANMIRQMHTEIARHQAMQVKQESARVAIDLEFEKVLARYRELRAEAPAATAPPATTTAPTTPDK